MKSLLTLFLVLILSHQVNAQSDSALKIMVETNSEAASKTLPTFALTFLNNGRNNLLLNLGGMLGNGEEIWTNISAVLKRENGKEIPVTIGRPTYVGGRIYFLGIPFTPGSSYRLLIKPDSYYVGNLEHPKPGKYEIQFRYKGTQSEYRDSTQMPSCWEGELRSNWLTFVVSPDAENRGD